MTNYDKRRGFGDRINDWLDEPPGETFKAGKWRFWFPMLIGFSILNAVLTAMVFGSGGQLQTYRGAIMLSIGALLAWLCVGTLHYSDSHDVRMARGVAALDSVTLVFMIAHFCFLLWVQGHVWVLQSREAEYKAAAEAYNAKAEKVSADNMRIAEAAERVAAETTKAERLRNDTAYQQRKAAEAGARISARSASQSGQVGGLSTSPIELEKPEKPKESSTDFLTRWDLWVRLANFGELALAAITFIYIRNRSAKYNARSVVDVDEPFPAELDIENRAPARRENFTKKKETAKKHASFSFEGLKLLREALRDISFRLPGLSFKSYVRGDAVWILMVASRHGTQETTHSAKAKLSILDDALKIAPASFRARLEKFLRENGFDI